MSRTSSYVAARSSSFKALICSPLRSLQTAAVAGADSAFTPSNTIPIESASPCTLTFASNDTRLLLGLASGEILVYDTSHLLTGAQTQAKPIHSFQHAVGSSIGQVAANPSTSDATLGSLVAVVSRNGRVFVLNVQTFASEGGWMGTDEAFQPTAGEFGNLTRFSC